MSLRRSMLALSVVVWMWGSFAQAASSAPLTDDDLRSLLVWSSPWEGRANPPQAYSYRTVFRQRRDALIAETTSYTTNQRSDSVVSVSGGRVNWQDSNGGDVNVAPAETGDLVGTASSQNGNLSVTFKPRR